MENNIVATIHPMSSATVFSATEANELLPLLTIISTKTAHRLDALNKKLHRGNNQEIQEEINACLQKWADNVRRLGAVPISLHRVRIELYTDQDLLWEFANPSKFKVR